MVDIPAGSAIVDIRAKREQLEADLSAAEADVARFQSKLRRGAEQQAAYEAKLRRDNLKKQLADFEAERKQELALARQLVNTLDPAAAAEERRKETVQQINVLKGKGIPLDQQALKLETAANAQYEKFLRSQQTSGGLKQHQLTNLSFQANDVATGLLSGQGLGQIAAQQGGQIFQILQQAEGGFAAGLAGLGASIGGFLVNPLTLAAGAAAGLAASFISVEARAADTIATMRQFKAISDVVPGGSKFSPAQIENTARSLDAFGGSLKDVKAELTTFSKEGFDPAAFEALGKASEYVAKVWSVDLKQASSDLAKGFSGAYEDIITLNEQYPFLDANEKKEIKNLYDTGRASDARNEAFRIFTDKYAPAYNDALTESDKVQKAVAGSFDQLMRAFSNLQPIINLNKYLGEQIGKWTDLFNRIVAVNNLSGEAAEKETARLPAQLNADFEAISKAQEALDKYRKTHRGSNIEGDNEYKALKRTYDLKTQDYARDSKRLDDLKAVKTKTGTPTLQTPEAAQAKDNDDAKKRYDSLVPKAKQLEEIERARTNALNDFNHGLITQKQYQEEIAAINKRQLDYDKQPKVKLTDNQRQAKNAIESVDKTVAALGKQNDAQDAANKKIADGTLTLDDYASQQEIVQKLSQYQDALDGASGAQKDELQSKINKLTEALKRQQDLDTDTQYLRERDAIKQQNEQIDIQHSLLDKTNRDRLIAIAQLQAEQEARQKGYTAAQTLDLITERISQAQKEASFDNQKYVDDFTKSVDAEADAWAANAEAIDKSGVALNAYLLYARKLSEAKRQNGGLDLSQEQKDQLKKDADREASGANLNNVLSRGQQSLSRPMTERFQDEKDAYDELVKAHKTALDQLDADDKDYQQKKKAVDDQFNKSRLAIAGDFFDNLAGLTSSSNEKLKAIGKAAAIAQATIATYEAEAKAIASAPFPFNLPAIAFATIEGAARVASIAELAGGGFVSGPGGPRDDMIPARLSNGEFVVNAAATSRNRPTLEAINRGMAAPFGSARSGSGAGQGSGGEVGVRIYVDDAGNLQAMVEQISGRVAANVTKANLNAYDSKLPQRVIGIQADSRVRR